MTVNKKYRDAQLLRGIRKNLRRLFRYAAIAESPQKKGRALARLTKRLKSLIARLNPLMRPFCKSLPALALCLGVNVSLLAQAPKINNLSPAANETAAASDANIKITFSDLMRTSSIGASTIRIYGSQSGFLSDDGAFSGNPVRTFNPNENFKPGELISATVTTDAETSFLGTNMAAPAVWSFRAAVGGGTGLFDEQTLTVRRHRAVALGDLDNDGDIDAIVARGPATHKEIWLNNGDASFSISSLGDNSSRDVVLGDFNDDGYLDALIANEGLGGEAIWLNNGDATFSSTNVGGYDSYGVDAGDLDGDGDLDIVIANDDQAQNLWLNNGDGTFVTGTFGSGKSRDVAIGDLDGDEDLDVIIANRGNNNNGQEIWLNNGDATFTSSSFGGGNSRGLALGDLDGDGDLDAIIANYDAPQEVWLNNGDATFSSFTFGSGKSEDVALGDIDADGDLDAVIANYDAAQEIWFNTGSAAFISREFGCGTSQNVALGDLDGDGDLDAFFANYSSANSSQGSIWLNYNDLPRIIELDPATNANTAVPEADITITFDDLMSNATLTTASFPPDGNLILFGHQSGNKSADALLSYGDKTVRIDPATDFFPGELVSLSVKGARNEDGAPMFNTESFDFRIGVDGGSGSFAVSSFVSGDFGGVSLGDLDNDGDLDALLVSEAGDHSIWLNNGDGLFNATEVSGADGRHAALGDLDGDNDLDVIVISRLEQANSIWLNNGDASFSTSFFGGSSSTRDLALGDLDGDGDLDALFANTGNTAPANEMWLNNGDGSFVSSTFGSAKTRSAAIGDLDGDGDLDALFGGSNGYAHEVWLNNGDAGFATTTFSGSQSNDLVLGDLDGDGDLDALAALGTGQAIWLNNGDGTFSTSSSGTYSGRRIALGDLDGDGDLDALIANDEDPQEIWLNNGDASFASSTQGAGSSQGVALGDLDGDGDLDAVIAANYSGGVGNPPAEIWRNISPPEILSLAPEANDKAAAPDSGIRLRFNRSLDITSVKLDGNLSDRGIIVHGDQSGLLGTNADLHFEENNTVVVIDPGTSFFAGETISVTVDDPVNTHGDIQAVEYHYSFVTATDGGSDNFLESVLGTYDTRGAGMADLDHDGDLDLVSVVRTNSHIWFNEGAAGFSNVSVSAGLAVDIDFGDLDGDGDTDALLATQGGAPTRLWLNNGDGTFATSTIGPNSNSRGVAIGDLDGDGDLDAIFANNGDNPINIFRNTGDGNFSFDTLGAFNSAGVDLGDLDDDGDLDAILAIGDDAQVILLNNGNADFSSSTFGGGRSKGVAIGDLDCDGDLDAIVTNIDTLAGQEIWLNNGDASFTSSSFGIAASEGVALGDLDGDGDLDAVFANDEQAQNIWFNNGDATFTSSTRGISDGRSTAVALGDIDGDGDLDAFFSNNGGTGNPQGDELWINRETPLVTIEAPPANSLTVPANSLISYSYSEVMRSTTVVTAVDPADANILVYGSLSGNISTNALVSVTTATPNTLVTVDLAPAFKPGELISISLGGAVSREDLVQQPYVHSFRASTATASGFFDEQTFASGDFLDVEFGDLDGDGDLDAFIVDALSQLIWLNNGDGTFISSNIGSLRAVAAALGDLDGDGDLDAVVVDGSVQKHTLWLNNGDASFASSQFGFGEISSDVAIGDLDGDGFLDIVVVSGRSSDPNEIWLNNGDASFRSSGFADDADGIALGDLDNDGDLDVVLARISVRNELWLNNGDGSFSSSTIANGDSDDVAIGDLDGDGDLDMVFSRNEAEGPELLINNGNGTFSSGILLSGRTSAVELGDLDGDGDLDLIVSKFNEPQTLLFNNGDASFRQSAAGPARSSNDLAIGDLNGDAMLDIVVANQFSPMDILFGLPRTDIIATDPAVNALDVATNANVSLTFSESMDTATLRSSSATTQANLFVHGSQTGQIATKATISFASSNTLVTIDPAGSFKSGEEIYMTVTGARSSFGVALEKALVYRFHAAVQLSSDEFALQSLPGSFSQGVALGDLDGDGDLDALFASDNGKGQEIWLNDGAGGFVIASLGDGNSRDIVLGDLDGDGDLDAIVANYQQAQEIWLNNGDGSFSSSTLGGRRSTGIDLGDLDGDGDLDAVIANDNDQKQEIFLNNGDGSFSSSGFGGGHSRDVAIGDLDGDGDLDVVIANAGGEPQALWFNSGGGVFSSTSFGAGSCVGVALGDLDGDGDLDVVLADDLAADRIWLNNGDGSFVSGGFGGAASNDLALVDLDSDGDLDILIAKTDLPQEKWLNNGDATFRSNTFGSAGAGTALALGDLDGDGALDAFVSHGEDNRNDLLIGVSLPRITALSPTTNAIAAPRNSNINIDFAAAIDESTATANAVLNDANLIVQGMQSGHLTTKATLSATNGNRRLVIDPATDFFAGEQIQVTVKDVLSRKTGAPMPQNLVYDFRTAAGDGDLLFVPEIIGSDSIDAGRSIALGDLNGDGRLDIFTVHFSLDDIPRNTWLNNGDGSFAVQSLAAVSAGRDVKLGDLDGDGDLDALVANSFDTPNQIFINDGRGNFSVSDFGGSKTSYSIAIGDLDSDGDLDAVVGNYLAQPEIWLNNGDASFVISPFGSSDVIRDIGIGDLDCDGDLDIMFVGSGGIREIMLNNGDASFKVATETSIDGALGAAMGDLDGDGDLDVIITTSTSNKASEILLNNGDGSFASSTLPRRSWLEADMGDLDGDGDLDILIAGSSGVLLLNDGAGGLSSSNFNSSSSFDVKLGDMDGDGDLDVVMFGQNSSGMVIHYNAEPPPGPISVTPGVTTASLSAAQLSVQGSNIEVPVATLTVLDASGTPVGARNLPLSGISSTSLTAILPAGSIATTGTLTLTIATLTGSTSTTLTVINDRPVIKVKDTNVIGMEDQESVIALSLSDASPGIPGLTIIPPAADLTTVASIVRLDATSATTRYLVTPVTNASGSVPLTFSVSDGELSSSTTLTLSFLPVNDPPTIGLTQSTLIIDEDTSTSLSIQIGDIETPIEDLQLRATSNNQSLIPDGNLLFGATSATSSLFIEPVTNAHGPVDVTISVDDGELQRSTTLSLKVVPIDDAPEVSLSFNTLTGVEDTETSAVIRLHDVDTPFENLLLSGKSLNKDVLRNGKITFGVTAATTTVFLKPQSDGNGESLVTIKVDDGETTHSTSFTYSVAPVNDPPTVSITQSSLTIEEDASTALSIQLEDIDTLPGDLILSATSNNLSVIADSGLHFGTTGTTTSLTIEPVTNAHGQADITITVDDGEFQHSVPLAITVTPVLDPPEVLISFATVVGDEDVATSVSISLRDDDTALGDLVLSATSGNQSLVNNGSLIFGSTAATTTLFIDPQPDSNGDTPITVTVSDGETTQSTSFSYSVTPVNDPPTIAVTQSSLTMREDASAALSVDIADIDTPASGLILSATSSDQSLIEDAKLRFDVTGATTRLFVEPVPNANGQAELTLTVDDGEFQRSTSLTINLTPQLDPPEVSVSFATLKGLEDVATSVSISLRDDDTPFDRLILSAVPGHTDVVGSNDLSFGVTDATTTLFFDPRPDQNGDTPITISVSDGETTHSTSFTYSVAPVDDPPTIAITQSVLTIDEDHSTALVVSIADPDVPASSLILSASSSDQSVIHDSRLRFGATGATTSLFIEPVTNAFGQAEVTLTVDDGVFQRSTSLIVDVKSQDEAPVVSLGFATLAGVEDVPTSVSISLRDDDTPIDQLLLSATSGNQDLVANSTLSFGATAATTTLFMEPRPDRSGAASITVTVSDGALTHSTSFVYSVAPVNDPPEVAATTTSMTLYEDRTEAVLLLLTDVDTQFEDLSLNVTSHNQSILRNDGIALGILDHASWPKLTPVTNANGSVDLTATLSDGESTHSTTFTVTFLPVNDPPVISTSNNVKTTVEDTVCPLPFTLDDIDTPLADLRLTATSSNQSLFNDADLIFGVTGATTTLFANPVSDANGAADITITVDDGEFSHSTRISVTVNPVNDPPQISVATDSILCVENGATTLIISLSDVDTPLGGLQLNAIADDPSLLSAGGLSLSATAASVTLSITPNCGQTGSAKLSLTASDGEFSRTTELTLSVIPAILQIDGATCACPDVPLDYVAMPQVSGASHSWTVTGGTIISGQGSETVRIIWERSSTASLALKRTNLRGCVSTTNIDFEPKDIVALMDHYLVTTANLPAAANDIGSNLEVLAVGEPYGGTASIVDGKVSYTPDEEYTGLDYFRYTAGIGDCQSTGAIVIAVEGEEAAVNIHYEEVKKDRVGGVRGLRGAHAVAVAPDGGFVYVAGRTDHAIAIFKRKVTTASLEYQGRVQNNSAGVKGLKYVMDLTISPDGQHLYAAGYGENAVAVFGVNTTTGTLSFLEWIKQGQNQIGLTVNGLTRARALTVSPDGRNVYVNGYSGHSLAVFERKASGRLQYLDSFTDGSSGVDGLKGAIDVAVSPDGTSVYSTGYSDNAIALFSRSLIDGRLSYEERYKDGQGGVDGLAGAITVAVSPDGRHVYAAGQTDKALALFKRDSENGSLSYVNRYKDGVDGVDGLYGVRHLLVSPDGRHVWAAGTDEDAVALFERDPASGELTWLERAKDGLKGVDGLDMAMALAVDPLSQWLYVAGNRDNALAALYRNRLPVAEDDAPGSVLLNAAISIDALGNDSDPDAHSLSITEVTGASLGTATIAGGGTQISYTAGAATGAESIDYTISDGHGGESTATVQLNLVLPKQSLKPAPVEQTGGQSLISFLAMQPNPVREQARIEFGLTRDAVLRISISDLRGRIVALVDERDFGAGRHALLWQAQRESGAPLAAGTYILLLEELGADGARRALTLPFLLQR